MTTPSQHLGANPKGFLSVITQRVSQGDCMHSEEQSVLEDPKKKESKMTIHFKQIMYYLVLGPRPNGCSQFNLNISKLLSYFFQKTEINAIFFFFFKNSKSKRSTSNCQSPETCIRKEGHHRTSEGSLCNSLRQGTEVSRL